MLTHTQTHTHHFSFSFFMYELKPNTQSEDEHQPVETSSRQRFSFTNMNMDAAPLPSLPDEVQSKVLQLCWQHEVAASVLGAVLQFYIYTYFDIGPVAQVCGTKSSKLDVFCFPLFLPTQCADKHTSSNTIVTTVTETVLCY